jgi:hypothetical protein
MCFQVPRVPHFDQRIQGWHAFVGFVGMVQEFEGRFGIDRALGREVGFEAEFALNHGVPWV